MHSTLDVRRNPESDEVSAPLELDGDSLTLESVALDGADLAAGDYEDRGDQLVIRSVPEQFTLTVVTWIEPQNNTRLHYFLPGPSGRDGTFPNPHRSQQGRLSGPSL